MKNWPFFCGHAWHRPNGIEQSGVFFRVWGWGLHISTKERSEALFAERNGLRRVVYLFGLRIEGLRR